MAIVVPKPGVDFQPGDLIAFCRERLARYKCPKSVTVVEALLPPLPEPPVEEDVPALPDIPIVVQPPLPPALPGGVEVTVPGLTSLQVSP